jgi:hypothetical protein
MQLPPEPFQLDGKVAAWAKLTSGSALAPWRDWLGLLAQLQGRAPTDVGARGFAGPAFGAVSSLQPSGHGRCELGALDRGERGLFANVAVS